MDLSLSGKTVVITGGSQGIGLACAETFAAEGCHLHLISRSEVGLNSAKQGLRNRFNVDVHVHCLDLSQSESLAALCDLAPWIDILVNNAGSIPGGGLEQVEERRWRESWELKLFGYVNLARMMLPIMMGRGHGVILNVIGIAGADPRYGYVYGSTANAALMAFTQSVGSYSSRRGVRVLGVNPGATQTERLIDLYKGRALTSFGDETRWRELTTDLPFGRPALPSEIADLVVFLASQRASYLSGTVVNADGGGMYR